MTMKCYSYIKSSIQTDTRECLYIQIYVFCGLEHVITNIVIFYSTILIMHVMLSSFHHLNHNHSHTHHQSHPIH